MGVRVCAGVCARTVTGSVYVGFVFTPVSLFVFMSVVMFSAWCCPGGRMGRAGEFEPFGFLHIGWLQGPHQESGFPRGRPCAQPCGAGGYPVSNGGSKGIQRARGRTPGAVIASRAPPGYAGHVPGKHAVYGECFQQANKTAVATLARPPVLEREVPPDMLHRRAKAPPLAGAQP